jgi:hypothetical protein
MAVQALKGSFRRPKRVDANEEAPDVSLFAIHPHSIPANWQSSGSTSNPCLAQAGDNVRLGVTCQYETCCWHTASSLVVYLTWCYHGPL